jgi:hypothetical protein
VKDQTRNTARDTAKDTDGYLPRREMLRWSACAAAVATLLALPRLAPANAAPAAGKEMVHEFPSLHLAGE